MIRTPDQRVRVFVSSTMAELAPERAAVRAAIDALHLTPVLFELGARPHAPRALYRSYLAQSDVFIGVYWEKYGWIAPGETISGLEDEYLLSGSMPRLQYLKSPAPDRDPALTALIERMQADDTASYRHFREPDELGRLVTDDLALLLSERFDQRDGAPSPPRGRPAPPHLPEPLDPTIGRAVDTRAIGELLAGGVRLLTLTGAGGIGKSRLALDVARARADDHPDGVWVVPLAAVAHPELVLPTIAATLGACADSSGSALADVRDLLRDARALLVLDNFEHLSSAGPLLLGILDACPNVRLLVTSRHRLRLRGEHEYAVSPLSSPVTDALEEIVAAPAVTLFASRVRDVRPGFEVTEDNAVAVAEICRLLDGLPLAIELAAARMRVLSPEALRARLGPDALLGSGATDLPERQRTMRATLDWSYDLLDEAERAVFARLSVFAGGWTMAAAEMVCGSAGEPDVLDTVSALLDKRLVVATEGAEGHPRFDMLQTVRAYAHDRLTGRGELQATRARHAGWYAALGRAAAHDSCQPWTGGWLAGIEPERDNLRAAARYLLDSGDDDALSRLVEDLFVYLFQRKLLDERWLRGIHRELRAWLDEAAAAGRRTDAVVVARIALGRGLMAVLEGDFDAGRPLVDQALAVFVDGDHALDRAIALAGAGIVALADRDLVGASARLEEAASLFEAVGHRWSESYLLNMVGGIALARGDLVAAEAAHRASLSVAAAIDSAPLVAQALTQLGLVALRRRALVDAHRYLADAVGRELALGYPEGMAYTLEVLAELAVAEDAPEAATRALAAAAATRAVIGRPPWSTMRAYVDRVEEAVRGQLDDAAIAAAQSVGRQWDLRTGLEETARALGTAA